MTRRGDLEFGSIPRLVRKAAERHGERDALVDGETRLSFAGLLAASRTTARALLAAGISTGDRVAIWAPNTWEWVVAALAIQSVGAALVPINTRYKGAEVGAVLERSRARMLFSADRFLGVDYPELLRAAGVAAPPTVRFRTDEWNEFHSRAAQVSDEEAEARALAVGPDDPSDVMFTSGTTGRPKAVVCTHGQTLRAFTDWCDAVGLRPGDRYLVVLPFFHSFGYKAGWLASLIAGATIFPEPVFDVERVLERVERDRITMLPGPPALYQQILAHAGRSRFDLSTLRLAVTGAAAIPVELVDRMRRELGFETVLTGYGLTEATGVSTICGAGDDAVTVATTSGRAIPGVEVRVIDEAGGEVPRGQPGEILIRGYSVARGDGEGEDLAIDRDGWLHTGDIGVLDARDYIRITDRKKDMFIVGGFNAYPAEIENVLLGHPAIARVAVVGAPDERLGEVGVAFVVPRAGARVDPEELVEWSRARMANYKVPRRVLLVDDLPVNATGKVLKHELRRRLAHGIA